MSLAYRRLTPDFTFLYFSGGGTSCFSYDMRSEYHTQLAEMSFDKIFDLTAGVYFFIFYNMHCVFIHTHSGFACALSPPRVSSTLKKSDWSLSCDHGFDYARV